MPVYHRLGKVPHKRHTVFRKPDGGLYCEELLGTLGFSGVATLAYHLHPPTDVKEIGEPWSAMPDIIQRTNLRNLSFRGFDVPATEDFLESRKVLFVNNDLQIGLAAPSSSMTNYFYKNGDSDEMIFVHKGSGTLHTMFGDIDFGFGDYLIIPRGTIYQLEFETKDNRFLIMETRGPITTPKRYRNEFGQLGEHSPFCERDFRLPSELKTYDEKGAFQVMIKKHGNIHPYEYTWHPFDVVGWDGFFFPFAFNIKDFEPLTGRIHMPPPIHQTFEASNVVICSFVPRLYDYHPEAIPAPYYHSNLDSDEILYYVEGDFMSRNDIQQGQITLHTGGIPHGPHPGAIERSIGAKETKELAVMIDPFNPLMITSEAQKLEVEDYYRSWVKTQKV